MKNNGLFLRVLWIVSGVLLIAAGVLSMWNPQAVARFFTVLFGVVLLLSGLLDIAAFLKCRHAVVGAGWILTDGLLTVLMAVFLLCNQWLAGLAIPVIFCMWILFSGISSVVRSLDLKLFGVRGWGWFCFLESCRWRWECCCLSSRSSRRLPWVSSLAPFWFFRVWPRSSPACFPDAFCPDTHMKKHVQMGCNR